MKKLSALLFGLMIVAGPAFAAYNAVAPNDPCVTQPRLTAPINISSATTTSIITPVGAGATIEVCGIWLNSVGGTSTLEYGTGATCGTGTTVLTGPIAAATTVSVFGNSTLMATPGNNRLCILSGASTSATNGWLVYVTQ